MSFVESSESVTASNQDTGILRLSLAQDEVYNHVPNYYLEYGNYGLSFFLSLSVSLSVSLSFSLSLSLL